MSIIHAFFIEINNTVITFKYTCVYFQSMTVLKCKVDKNGMTVESNDANPNIPIVSVLADKGME